MHLLLASASPRRQALIRLITDDVICRPANVDECVPDGLPPRQAPAYLAVRKARAVAQDAPEKCVLGCDTAVLFEENLLGKPKDRSEAANMLEKLSGRTHEVITGCAILTGEKETVFSVTTAVTFYPLTADEIAAYVATGEADDKAGAYGIQGKGALFVREIKGDYYNVVGLPIAELARRLKTMKEL